MHERVPTPARRIACHMGPRALAHGVRPALATLGYELLLSGDPRSDEPDLRIADERLFARLPDTEAEPRMPVVLLCGSRPLPIDDRRILGRCERPGQLSELYGVLQRVFEPHPRQVPRTATRLTARASQADRRWVGSIRSLSEAGCYLESSCELGRGERINLQFALPRRHGAELVTTRAECVTPRERGAGLVFREAAEEIRRGIRDFVALRLATLQSSAAA